MATLTYTVQAIDGASGTFAKIALSAEDLSKQVDDLAKKRADIKVGLDDKTAQASLKDLDLKLTKLKAKTADPNVSVKGLESAYYGIGRLDVALDRLGAKHVTATVDVNVNRSFLSRLRGLVPGGGAGGGAVAGGQAVNAGGNALGGALGALGPYGQVAAIGAGVAGAAALGPAAIPAALGLGAGAGGLLLTQAKGLQTVLADIIKTLKTAAAPLKGAFGDILKDFDQFVKSQGPALRDLFRASLPFLSAFVKILEQAGKTILPVITSSLKQMTPYIPLLVQGFTALIQGVADMIKAIGPRGMQASAMLFVDLCRAMGGALTVLGKTMNFLAVAVQETSHAVHQTWDRLRHDTAVIFDGIRHDIATIWDTIWRNTVGRAQNGVAAVVSGFRSLRTLVGGVLANLRSTIAGIWDTIWNNTVTRVRSGIATVLRWLGTLPGQIRNIFHGALTWLNQAGRQVVQGLWNGLLFVWNKVKSFISGIAGWIKAHKGPLALDSRLLEPAGRALMSGLHLGLLAGSKGPLGFITGLTGTIGSLLSGGVKALFGGGPAGSAGGGVQQWRGLVLRALAMEHLPASLVNDVLYQMQTESGGNPRAINLTDSNAAAGDPSRGLMQTILSTFEAYHWPGTSWNIYDPLANIAAAINYGAHNGRGFGSGPGQIGSGHGYALGGIISEPIWGIGASGRHYSFGERGPEIVIPSGGGGGSMAETNALLRQAIALLRVAPSATSAGTARALNSAARAAVR